MATEPNEIEFHVAAVLNNLEAMDEAGENFTAEVLKYDAENFPVGAIRELQRWADENNAYRRQMVREVKKLLSVAIRASSNRRATERIAELAERAAIISEELEAKSKESLRRTLWSRLFG